MKFSRMPVTTSLVIGLLGIAALASCASPVSTATTSNDQAPTPAASATDSTATATGATASTACDIVSEQDATTALGADPGAGVAVSTSGASSCTFGHYPSLVTINMVGPGGKADLAHIRSADTTGSLTDIPGIGDSAFGVSTGPVASVWFSKGDTMVAIVVVGGSSGGPFIDQAKVIATTALAHL